MNLPDNSNYHKAVVMYNLINEIKQSALIIKDELCDIKTSKDWEYTPNKLKKDKHYPAVSGKQTCNEYYNKYIKDNIHDVSFSLSSESINDQLAQIWETVKNRCNGINMYTGGDECLRELYKVISYNIEIDNPIDHRKNIRKYTKGDSMRTRFPKFYDGTPGASRFYYDIIYTVLADPSITKIVNMNTCNTILICCCFKTNPNKKNIYHIFYDNEPDNKSVYGDPKLKLPYNDIESLYEDPSI